MGKNSPKRLLIQSNIKIAMPMTQEFMRRLEKMLAISIRMRKISQSFLSAINKVQRQIPSLRMPSKRKGKRFGRLMSILQIRISLPIHLEKLSLKHNLRITKKFRTNKTKRPRISFPGTKKNMMRSFLKIKIFQFKV